MRSVLVFLFLGFSFLNAQAQDRSAKFDSLFSQLHKENKFSGNALIAENGKPISKKSYGLAFREKGQALNSESIFELASVRKQFVVDKAGKISELRILRETGPAIEAKKVEKQKTLLAIFPHPDDETAIAEVLIKYRELGYKVQLIIATDGKDGTRVKKIPAGDSLGNLRKEETRSACKILGIDNVFYEREKPYEVWFRNILLPHQFYKQIYQL